jgi:hypothetical protein
MSQSTSGRTEPTTVIARDGRPKFEFPHVERLALSFR